MSVQQTVIKPIIDRYGEEIIIFTNASEKARREKALVSPFYYNDKPYKELTKEQKATLRIEVLPNVLLWSGTLVEYNNILYEVKKIGYHYDKGQTTYKWAAISPLEIKQKE